MKPSAQRAHPEYEFKTVIATGISADPILLVIFHPKAAEAAVVLNNDMRPIAYEGLEQMATRPKALTAPNGLFKTSLKGKSYPFLS